MRERSHNNEQLTAKDMTGLNNTPIASRTVKGKGRTYFLDLRESKKGNKYVQITESRRGQDGQNVRSSLFLFPDRVPEFQTALSEIAQEL
ncbi:MAG: DUF3276 family protein [Parcubacteria group bacterium]|nr:DUF3276 family protein [Parcubacteria group bacterium]